MEIENKIKELIPPKLKEIKNVIDYLLEVETNDKKTNLKYLDKNKFFCPNNTNHNIKKNGTKNGVQRYWCHDCKQSFSITNKSIINHSSLSYNQLKMILKCMYNFKSIKEMALEVGISETSVYEIEIKIFDAFEYSQKNIILKDVIQVDEKYFRTSFKGYKKDNMPRPSRYNGVSNLTSGISKDQVCVIVATDSYDNLIIKVVGNGAVSTNMIELALKGKVQSGSVLVTDSKSSYQKFAKDNNLILKQIPTNKHKIDNYTVNDVNEIMTEIENYQRLKRGLSSRHLQHHMNFIQYRKKIKYTIEYLEINEKMYSDIVVYFPTNLKSKKVYSTEMPFDISDYKEWYNSHI